MGPGAAQAEDGDSGMDWIRAWQTLWGKKDYVRPPDDGEMFVQNVSSTWDSRMPGSQRNFQREVGDPWKSGVLAPLLGWLARTFPEAPPMLVRRGPEGEEPVREHPLLDLLEDPNGQYGGDALWSATLLSRTVNGNAYWLIERANSGKVLRLWYAPHWMMTPVAKDGDFITGYERWVDGKREFWPRESVVHFRVGLDPDNPRLGLSEVGAMLREIATDNEAAAFMFDVLKNHGMSGGIISPDNQDASMNEEERTGFKKGVEERTTGDNRGRWMVLSQPFRVQVLGATPEDMVLDRVRQIPEARICAALGVSPMVIGYSAGLERSTYSNMREAKEGAYEQCVIPLKKSLARDVTRQLLMPNFPGADGLRLGWDYSNVRCLQEDETNRVKRLVLAAGGPIMSVNEARAQLGWESVEGMDEIRSAGESAGPKEDPRSEAQKLRDKGYSDESVARILAERRRFDVIPEVRQ